MSAMSDTVKELCTSFGLPSHDLPRGSHVALSIGAMGEVHFEEQEEELLVYLTRPIDVGDDRLSILRGALHAVHFHNVLPVPVQAALHGNELVFVARLQNHEIDLPALERTLELLSGLQEKARG